jgi:halocyanin-like protein
VTRQDGGGVNRRTVLRGGAVAAATAVGAGRAAGQEGSGDGGENVRPDFGDWLADVDGGYRDARGQDEVRVSVGASGNGGNFAFLPAGLWVDPGTTVIFEWTGKGQGHNVVREEGPAALDSGDPVAEPGVHYEYTFEEGGITSYYCVPHRALGMKGAVAVGEDVPTVQVEGADGAGDDGPTFEVPGSPIQSTLIAVFYGLLGLGAAAAMGVEGINAWKKRKERVAESAELGEEVTFSEEADVEEPAETIGHDEYDPVGTATLIIVYLAIVAIMWVFMYFVEFLGGGPTVIG